jgi:hypothetical protein
LLIHVLVYPIFGADALNTKHDSHLRSFLDTVRLGRLCVRHLRVFRVLCRRCIRLLLCLSFAFRTFELGLLGCMLLLLLLEYRLPLALNLVVVSLNDWASNGPNFLLLGDVLCLCRILTIVV